MGDMKNPILQLSNIGQTEHINDLCKFNEEKPNVPFKSLAIYLYSLEYHEQRNNYQH